MTAYKLFWILLKAICRGHGNAPVYFDTEGRKFEYHFARVGSGDCEEAWTSPHHWIKLYEERL